MLPNWPEAVRAYLQNCYGTPRDMTPLSGLSQNTVWRLCFADTCIVLKKTVAPKELNFYRTIAPQLVAQGVPIPRLEWSQILPDAHWLIIEYIPKPFPRERWLADSEAQTILHKLHHSTLQLSTDTDWLFRPRWDNAMTEAALTFFPVQTASALRPLLVALQARCQPLFEPRCWISGDPNPGNWGLREDGSLVLFDWERFGRGTPALDVAITIPGLPPLADFQKVAAIYLRGDDSAAIESFTHDIALAKLWTAVEFLSEARVGQVGDASPVKWLVEQLPVWVEIVHKAVHSQ